MVLLTRGKDRALLARLAALGIEAAEVALLEQVDLPAFALLPGRLKEGWDFVAVTSKEGARRLLLAWEAAGRPFLRVAAVGEGTAGVLRAGGLPPAFLPPRATAKDLARAFPQAERVLFVAGDLAGWELEEGLRARGVEVERLEVYATRERPLAPEERELLEQAQVVAFFSPSGVRAFARWTAKRPKAAAIGPSTGEEARRLGFPVVEAESPGLEGLFSALLRALGR
ncbi:uroporphyrinogen-III synthase [Thermus thermophilus]|uniref:uroporphyrinogen-III synthase n=1 Tax=Thermus thermophilus TaxID=274 RepID=UPI00090AB276|nr:uroporphyrinogen-III synthase [Thermus thermophilus]BAW02457.1 uroporphyrinogen-III synthase [Thermus thermophilus]BDB10694.1 uroporphyrinogen III methyltransferase [Thermus thermophilus]